MPQFIGPNPAVDANTVAEHQHLSQLPEHIWIDRTVCFDNEGDFTLKVSCLIGQSSSHLRKLRARIGQGLRHLTSSEFLDRAALNDRALW